MHNQMTNSSEITKWSVKLNLLRCLNNFSLPTGFIRNVCEPVERISFSTTEFQQSQTPLIRPQHRCGSLKPRHKHLSVRTCLVQNPLHRRSLRRWLNHDETKSTTTSIFFSQQDSFSSKLEKYSRTSSLKDHNLVLRSLISCSCWSKESRSLRLNSSRPSWELSTSISSFLPSGKLQWSRSGSDSCVFW